LDSDDLMAVNSTVRWSSAGDGEKEKKKKTAAAAGLNGEGEEEEVASTLAATPR
jgi:hypothetical protein